jgi:hypothetical protein
MIGRDVVRNAARKDSLPSTVPGGYYLGALGGRLGLRSWWRSNVEPYVEPSVSSYVTALRCPLYFRPDSSDPSRVTLYLCTTSRDHV